MQKACPPNLLMVRDIMQRFPEQREAFLDYEIHRRERERVLYQSVRQVSRFHIWDTVKSVLLTGVTVFSLLYLLGLVSSFGHWFDGLHKLQIPLPTLFGKTANADVGSLVPTSTVLMYAAQLPIIGWKEAAIAALIVMVVLMFVRSIGGFLLWRRSRSIQNAVLDLEEEIEVLKSWES